MDGEILGWELLHGSDTDSLESHPSGENSSNLREIDGVPTGTLRSDHFSIDHLSEDDLVESDISGWLDPGLESSVRGKNPSEFLADSSADQSSDCQLSDAIVSNELGFISGFGGGIVSENGREMESETEISGESGSDECMLRDSGIADATLVESQAVTEEVGESHPHDDDSNKCWSDSGGEGLVSSNSDEINLATKIESDSRNASNEDVEGRGGNNIIEEQEQEESAIDLDLDSEAEGQKKSSSGVVWWKMPFVLLKYCVFKIGPVWSVSVAATVMGLVLLGRRLYNMKKKAQRFQLKVTMDDKKAWKVMGEAARLNEAFTEVRRVPIIRPASPAPATNPWPLLSLR